MADIAYRRADVDGLTVFYREAGASDASALALPHGFPTVMDRLTEMLGLDRLAF